MKKMKYVFSFLFVLSLGFIIAGCTGQALEVSADDTYVTLDINPSVELIVTPKEKVIYANPLNEDGELLLADLDLIGLDLEEAIDLIIEEAINLGFIDVDAEETLVSVSAISQNNTYGELIRNKVKENVNNAFLNRAMMGRAEDKGFTPEFIEEAEGYGVTPGFLFLAKKAVEVSDELLLEDALLMTQEELMTIVHEARLAQREVAQALRNAFFADRQLIVDEYLPQIQALEADIELDKTELEALVAEKDALVAQIALGEGDLVALQAQLETVEAQILADTDALAALEAELATLVSAFHDEMFALRTAYHEETAALRTQMMEQRQLRIQEHRAEVEAFMNQMQERREEREEAIKDYQGNRP